MTPTTRFDVDMDGSMEPSEDGQWVRFDEVQQVALERDVFLHERNHARAHLDRAVKILVGIHALLYPTRVEREGKVFQFRSPITEEQMQALSDRIRAIPDETKVIVP